MVKKIKFDVKRTTNYWCEGADYDLDTAETLFKTGKYPLFIVFRPSGVGKALEGFGSKENQGTCPIYAFFTSLGEPAFH